jgi:hypothetical protein
MLAEEEFAERNLFLNKNNTRRLTRQVPSAGVSPAPARPRPSLPRADRVPFFARHTIPFEVNLPDRWNPRFYKGQGSIDDAANFSWVAPR